MNFGRVFQIGSNSIETQKYKYKRIENRLISFLKRNIICLLRYITLPKMYLSSSHQSKCVIVTGTDDSHEKSLIQLIESLKLQKSIDKLIVFDFGMSEKKRREIASIKTNFPVEVSCFDFTEYPSWLDIKSESNGQYAWKSVSMKKALDKILNTELGVDEVVMIWFDAGNRIKEDLDPVIKLIATLGFWSPRSSGTIAQWTHPKVLALFHIKSKRLRWPNLNGAVVGFLISKSKTEGKSLFDKWYEYSKLRDFIGPIGANRSNHRHDQSLLTLLAIDSDLYPPKAFQNYHEKFIATHQDVDLQGENGK